MKLYATVTSERASKGQGGQKFLSIDIRNDETVLLFKMVIKPPDNGYPLSIDIDDLSNQAFMQVLKNKLAFTLDKLKAKKQKGDDSGKNGICVACKGKNPEGCTYC